MADKNELKQKQCTVLKQKMCFAKSRTLKEAFFMADHGICAHGRFLHYTTLSGVAQIVESGRWWLTRSDFDRLNDVQEAKKFGDSEIIGRTYQASFAYGSAESAAMWGLYCPGNPLGVMISLDGNEMRKWFAEIWRKKSKVCLEYDRATATHGRQVELTRGQIDMADARDVIYAATDFNHGDCRCQGRKHRSNKLFWFDMSTEEIDDLEQEIQGGKFCGWMKDYEWRQENESRIAVRVKSISGKLPNHLSLNIPEAVLKSMRFTLSPWLKEEFYGEVENVLCALFMKMHNKKLPNNIVARSGLTGALELWRERYHGYLRNDREGKKARR